MQNCRMFSFICQPFSLIFYRNYIKKSGSCQCFKAFPIVTAARFSQKKSESAKKAASR